MSRQAVIDAEAGIARNEFEQPVVGLEQALGWVAYQNTDNFRSLRVCPESFPYGNIALCRFSPTSRSRRDLKETAGFR
jgi:hypothetical protein